MARLSSSEKCFECFAKTGCIPREGKVLAHEDSQANGAAQPKTLVMAVAQADGEPASIEAGAEAHHSEHHHAGDKPYGQPD